MILVWMLLWMPFGMICCSPRIDPSRVPSKDTNVRSDSMLRSSVSFLTNKGPISFGVEVAKTPKDRATGLMFRQNLPNNAGMLFIFDEDAVHSFWMKNTHVSLDIVFMDHNWIVVGVIENAVPQSLNSLSIDVPSRYALEINGGLARQRGIDKGDKAVFVNDY